MKFIEFIIVNKCILWTETELEDGTEFEEKGGSLSCSWE